MSTSQNVIVLYQTDEEAGTVYSTVLKLKREGYFSSYNMYDGYALLSVPSSEVDTVLTVFNKLSDEKKLPGIIARITK